VSLDVFIRSHVFLVLQREERLFGMFTRAEPHDFGSQATGYIQEMIDVAECFSVPSALSAPCIEDQLQVFGSFMELGDIVARSSEAWIRVADKEGAGAPEALEMAQLCQQALDARKLATNFSREEVQKIDGILARFEAPDWKGGSSIRGGLSGTRESQSILGILFRAWRKWIVDLERAKKRRHRSLQNYGVGESQEESDQFDEETVFSVETDTCVVCYGKAGQQCPICISVWYCSE